MSLIEQVAALETARFNAEEAVGELKRHNAELREQLRRAVIDPDDKANQVHRLEATISRLKGEVADAKQTAINLARDNERVSGRGEREQREATESFSRLQAQLGRVSASVAAKDAEISRLRTERDSARSKIPVSGVTDEAAKELRGQLAAARADADRFRQDNAQATARTAGFRTRLDASERRVAELERAIDAKALGTAVERRQLAHADERIARLTGQVEELKRKLTQVSEERDAEVEGLRAKLTVKGLL